MASFWFFVVTAGPLILLAAIIYGIVQYRRRDRRLDPISDEGARQVRKDIVEQERRRAH